MRWLSSLLFIMLPMMAAAQSEVVYPWQVIASLTGDFDDDADIDRAVLVEDEGDAGRVVVDLYIFDEADDFSLVKVAYLADPFPEGVTIRQSFTLRDAPEDRFAIVVKSLDRDLRAQEEALIIGYLDEEYVVLSYSFMLPELVDTANTCTIYYDKQTLFMGGEHTVHSGDKAVNLADWNAAEAAAICGRF